MPIPSPRETSAVLAVLLLAGCSPSADPDSPAIDTMEYDDHGFRYRIDLLPGRVDVDVDSERSKPGEAVISLEVDALARMHNITPDRIAPLDRFPVDAIPVWDRSSAACAGDRDELFESGSYDVGEDQCTVVKPIWLHVIGPEEIPEGGFVTIAGDSEAGLQDAELVFPESEAEAAADALAEPDGWILVEH